nr:MAG TPA: hypothetical protein [Caudoviricetes sp.]
MAVDVVCVGEGSVVRFNCTGYTHVFTCCYGCTTDVPEN